MGIPVLPLIIVLPFTQKRVRQTYAYRKLNKFTVADFQNQLRYENWEELFRGSNMTLILNSFLNTYLRISNSCFPMVNKQKTTKNGKINWITPGMRVSCDRKRTYISG
jgi:hypothetical protein